MNGTILGPEGPISGLKGPTLGLRRSISGLKGTIPGLRVYLRPDRPISGLRRSFVSLRRSSLGPRSNLLHSIPNQQNAFWAMNERERIDVLKCVTVTLALVQNLPSV